MRFRVSENVVFPDYEDDIYDGETSRSLQIRNKKHQENYRSKKASFMLEHRKKMLQEYLKLKNLGLFELFLYMQ